MTYWSVKDSMFLEIADSKENQFDSRAVATNWTICAKTFNLVENHIEF